MDQKNRLNWFYRKILGTPLDLDNFDQKLIVQKIVYIAQQMGVKFDYGFGWWVRGVYSSPLTVDLYNINKQELTYVPTRFEEILAEKLLNIAGAFKNPVRAFEIVSTVVYAQEYKGMTDEKKISEFIKSAKPWFTDEEIEVAFKKTGELRNLKMNNTTG